MASSNLILLYLLQLLSLSAFSSPNMHLFLSLSHAFNLPFFDCNKTPRKKLFKRLFFVTDFLLVYPHFTYTYLHFFFFSLQPVLISLLFPLLHRNCFHLDSHWGPHLNQILPFQSWSYFSKEGNGTPLQYSGLENPRDGGAW